MEEFADLIRSDFLRYFEEVEQYFQCIDAERAHVFAQGREASQAYGRFIERFPMRADRSLR